MSNHSPLPSPAHADVASLPPPPRQSSSSIQGRKLDFRSWAGLERYGRSGVSDFGPSGIGEQGRISGLGPDSVSNRGTDNCADPDTARSERTNAQECEERYLTLDSEYLNPETGFSPERQTERPSSHAESHRFTSSQEQ